MQIQMHMCDEWACICILDEKVQMQIQMHMCDEWACICILDEKMQMEIQVWDELMGLLIRLS
jgi:hypothetical protein